MRDIVEVIFSNMIYHRHQSKAPSLPDPYNVPYPIIHLKLLTQRSHIFSSPLNRSSLAFLSPVCVCVLFTQLCSILCDPKTVAHQVPLSMEFSRQEYWSGMPHHPPGDLPHPGTEPTSLILLLCQAGSLPLSHLGRPYSLLDVCISLRSPQASVIHTCELSTA